MNNRKRELTKTVKPHPDYYVGWILKIAAAFNVEISEATQAVYLERLLKLTGEQMSRAGSKTIEEWTEASKMPPLAFILARITADTQNVNMVLMREDKPADWEPLQPGELEGLLEKVRSAAAGKRL